MTEWMQPICRQPGLISITSPANVVAWLTYVRYLGSVNSLRGPGWWLAHPPGYFLRALSIAVSSCEEVWLRFVWTAVLEPPKQRGDKAAGSVTPGPWAEGQTEAGNCCTLRCAQGGYCCLGAGGQPGGGGSVVSVGLSFLGQNCPPQQAWGVMVARCCLSHVSFQEDQHLKTQNRFLALGGWHHGGCSMHIARCWRKQGDRCRWKSLLFICTVWSISGFRRRVAENWIKCLFPVRKLLRTHLIISATVSFRSGQSWFWRQI